MGRQVLPGLRTTFLIHVIVAAVFGLGWLLIPETIGGLFGVKTPEPFLWRMIGAATLAFGASSWWAWRETDFERVKIIVEMEMFWTALAAILYLYAVVSGAYPISIGLGAILMAGFFFAFGYYYMKEGATAMTPVRR